MSTDTMRRAATHVLVVTRDVLGLVACLTLTGCAGYAVGTFGASGGLLGVWSADAGGCSASVSQMGPVTQTGVTFNENPSHPFRGADLSTGVFSGAPPFGGTTVVIVTRPSPLRQLDLRRETCARFEEAHHPHPDGSIGADVELDCTTSDGGRVVASLHAASCR